MIPLDSLLDSVVIAPSDGVMERARGLARAGDGTDRDRFEPGHFTASGLVVSPDGSSLLLVHHRRLDRWLQPGGHIDAEDASPLQAARREVLEETGIATEPLNEELLAIDIHGIPARAPEPAHEHFDLRFALRAINEAVVVDDEVHDVVWARWEDLGRYGLDDSVARAAVVLRGIATNPR